MKKVDMTNVQESGSFVTLPAGAYAAIITDVEDVPDKEYLKVTYDIYSGYFSGYFTDQRKRFEENGWRSAWIGAYVKSYKTKALPMFKRFCSAISKSNGNFIFDGGSINADEKSLIGKKFGIVLREEEYYNNSGDKRTRLIVHSECPLDILSQVKVPDAKKLLEEPGEKLMNSDFVEISNDVDEVVPF